MSSINWGRVILGGLVAGMLINVVEFLLNDVGLAKDWEGAILALGTADSQQSACSVLYLGLYTLGLSNWHLCGLALRGHSSPLRCRTEDCALRGIVRLGSGLSLAFSHTVSSQSLASPNLWHWPYRGTAGGLAGNSDRCVLISPKGV